MAKKIDEKKEIIQEIKPEAKPKKMKTIWIVLICLGCFIYFIVPFAFIGVTLYLDTNTGIDYEVKEDSIVLDEDKAILRNIISFYDEETEIYIIEGYIDNKELTDVTVMFELYDENGVVLGTADGYVNSMKKDTSYKFKAYYSEYDSKDIKTYKIVSIDSLLF